MEQSQSSADNSMCSRHSFNEGVAKYPREGEDMSLTSSPTDQLQKGGDSADVLNMEVNIPTQLVGFTEPPLTPQDPDPCSIENTRGLSCQDCCNPNDVLQQLQIYLDSKIRQLEGIASLNEYKDVVLQRARRVLDVLTKTDARTIEQNIQRGQSTIEDIDTFLQSPQQYCASLTTTHDHVPYGDRKLPAKNATVRVRSHDPICSFSF